MRTPWKSFTIITQSPSRLSNTRVGESKINIIQNSILLPPLIQYHPHQINSTSPNTRRNTNRHITVTHANDTPPPHIYIFQHNNKTRLSLQSVYLIQSLTNRKLHTTKRAATPTTTVSQRACTNPSTTTTARVNIDALNCETRNLIGSSGSTVTTNTMQHILSLSMSVWLDAIYC